MFSQVFLGVTGREMERFHPKKVAYMACHFSSGGTGLSNLPQQLPEGSVLLVDDSMPVQGHDPETVAGQLTELVNRFSPRAVLLDFQRPQSKETDGMFAAISEALPCPVAATPVYAIGRDCPVFLPPVAVNKPLEPYLRPWLKRGVFLEIAPETARFTVTKEGCISCPAPWENSLPAEVKRLHCHYREEAFPGKVVFTVTRTREDLGNLCREGYDLGIWGAVGLYRELVGTQTVPCKSDAPRAPL